MVIEASQGRDGELGNTDEGGVEIEDIEEIVVELGESGEVRGVGSESNEAREVLLNKGECFVDDVKDPLFFVCLFRFCWPAASLRGGGIFMIGAVRRRKRRLTGCVSEIKIDDVGTLTEEMTKGNKVSNR